MAAISIFDSGRDDDIVSIDANIKSGIRKKYKVRRKEIIGAYYSIYNMYENCVW